MDAIATDVERALRDSRRPPSRGPHRAVARPGRPTRSATRASASCAEYGIAPPHRPAAGAGPRPGRGCSWRCAARTAARADTRELQPLRLHGCKALWRCQACRRAVRPLQGDLSDRRRRSRDRHARVPPAAGGRGRPAHRRRGRVTFDVPAELRDDYALRRRPAPHGAHGPSAARRCGATTRSARPPTEPAGCGSASSGLEGGAFSGFADKELRPGDSVDVMTPDRPLHVPLDPANAKHYARGRRRQRHHPGAVDRRHARSRSSRRARSR